MSNEHDPDLFAVTRTRLTGDATVGVGNVPPPAAGWLPDVPGYTVLKELGRGGMGVVFEAVQTGLNRPVALKMVLNARLSTPERLIRFLIEAETLARLSHPNIVQIHEIGRYGPDGVPFLALEYVAGGTLAEALKNCRLAPPEAALLTERLARAVQHAHSHGVVHRDLKPSNVLLGPDHTPGSVSVSAGTGCRVFGTVVVPKVSDFGLAKSVTDPCVMTAAGTIVGTPSYMAPEQASGSPDVSTAADVYSLGAVLYELLTGRPPFIGDNPVSVVRLVLEESAPRPRSLVPGLPRDLETICLKCLDRDPDKRYPTADALADDLLRFRAGRPVRARPVGPAGRLWRWGRRNPAIAGLTAGVLLAVGVGAAGVVWQWRQALEHAERAELREREAEAERQRAEANFALATDAVDRYLAGVSQDDRLRTDEFTPLRRELLGTAREFYRRFVAEKADDPASRLKLGMAYTQLAVIAANADDDPSGSAALSAEALSILDKLAAEPAGADRRVRVVRAYARQVSAHPLIMRKEFDRAFPILEEVLAEYRKLAPDSDRARDYRVGLARYLDGHYRRADRPAAAATAARDWLEAATDQAGRHPDNPRYARELPVAALRLGLALRVAGDPAADAALADAERRFQSAPGLDERTRRRHLAAIAYNRGLAARAEGRPADALALLTTAVGRYAEFLDRWVDDDARAGLAGCEVYLAEQKGAAGDHRAAHDLIVRATVRWQLSDRSAAIAVRALEAAADQARADPGLAAGPREEWADRYLHTAGTILTGVRGTAAEPDARAVLARALATWPDPQYRNPSLAVRLADGSGDPVAVGMAKYAAGDYPGAKTAFDAAAGKLDPAGRYYRAMTAKRQGDPAAKTLYDEAAAAGPAPRAKAEADRLFGLAPAAARPAYRAAAGLDRGGLDGWLAAATAEGFTPDAVHAHPTPDGPRFAAVAVHRPGHRPVRQTHFDTGVDGFQQRFNRLADAGFWPTSLCGYDDGGKPRYVSVWVFRPAGPRDRTRHAMLTDELSQMAAAERQVGGRPLHLSAYLIDGRPLLTVLFGPAGGRESDMRAGVPLARFPADAEARRAAGWRPGPTCLVPADTGGLTVMSVGIREPGAEWVLKPALTAEQFAAEQTARTAAGFHPETVVGYHTADGSRYLAVWVKAAGGTE